MTVFPQILTFEIVLFDCWLSVEAIVSIDFYIISWDSLTGRQNDKSELLELLILYIHVIDLGFVVFIKGELRWLIGGQSDRRTPVSLYSVSAFRITLNGQQKLVSDFKPVRRDHACVDVLGFTDHHWGLSIVNEDSHMDRLI